MLEGVEYGAAIGLAAGIVGATAVAGAGVGLAYLSGATVTAGISGSTAATLTMGSYGITVTGGAMGLMEAINVSAFLATSFGLVQSVRQVRDAKSPDETFVGWSGIVLSSAGMFYFGYNKGITPTTSQSGPKAGVIQVSRGVRSLAAFKVYKPSGGGSEEFVFDPVTETFVVGDAPYEPGSGLSPHQRLASSIGAKRPVGGMFRRLSDGSMATNENSGHYGENWTNEIRAQFKAFMKTMTGEDVHHEVWPE